MPWPAIITGAATMGSALMGGGGGEGRNLGMDYARKRWLTQMAKKYPKFKELALGPESMALASRMMKGELAPGVEQAYGGGAEREYGGLRSMLSEIGAGPASMGLARAGVMRKLGETMGGARERAVEQGMGFAPQAFEMGMQPYQAERSRWGDIANMYLQMPEGAFLKEGQSMGFMGGGGGGGAPATPAQTAMQNRMMEQQQPTVGASPYPLTPMQMAWQRMRKPQTPAVPLQSVTRRASGYSAY